MFSGPTRRLRQTRLKCRGCQTPPCIVVGVRDLKEEPCAGYATTPMPPRTTTSITCALSSHGWAGRCRESSATGYTRPGPTRSGSPPAAYLSLSSPACRCARPPVYSTALPAHAVHASPPTPGEQVPLVGGPLIEIVDVAEPTAHLLRAVDLYGPSVRALQVVHADDRGHWPWDRGYRGVRGGQPVLGIRAPHPIRQP